MAYTANQLPNGLDAKTTPVDADVVVTGDSADGNRAKKVTWANIKATLLAYFDTAYQPLSAVLTATTASFTTALETKLNGIQAGAQVNTVTSVNTATGAVVLDADDIDDTTTTHKFTTAGDISKLAGIEALADVTDATNVDAAGAVMNSDTSTASMSFVIDEDNMVSNSATKVPTQQSVKAYVDANSGGASALDDLTDVTITTPSNGQVLKYNGSAWVNGTDETGGAGVSDGDKGDITVSGSGATWTIDNDTIGLDELSATGTPSASTFLRGDNSWATPAGGGDVSKVGTPADNQIGVWTGDGTIEGDAGFTFDGGLNVTVADAENKDGLTITQNDTTNDRSTLLLEDNTDGGATVFMRKTNDANGGVLMQTDHVSATPANWDAVFELHNMGRTDTNVTANWGTLYVYPSNVSNTAKESGYYFDTFLNNSSATRLIIGSDINGVKVGASTASGVVESNGNQDLILQTGNATTGNITIVDGADGDITLAPNGNGDVIVRSSADGSTLEVKDSANTGLVQINAFPTYAEVYVGDDSSGSFVDIYAQDASTYIRVVDTSAGATGPAIDLYHNSASPAGNDIVGEVDFNGEDSAGNKQSYATVKGIITDPTSTSEDGKIAFGVTTAGTLADELELIGSALYPTTNNGLDLGTSSLLFNNTYTTAIELGHASDTTLSRTGAGAIAVEGVAVPTISSTNTLTNKRVSPRTGTTTSSATPTINTDNVDFYSITAQAEDITSFTTNLSGTPTEGQKLWIAITGTAARAITWGASFEASTVALPTTTVTTARLDVGFVWNTVTSKWRCIAVA